MYLAENQIVRKTDKKERCLGAAKNRKINWF